MNQILLELEEELFKFNNPESLFIPADLLELLENPPDPFCYWDLTEEEREELFFPNGCQCKKCLIEELGYESCWEPFNLKQIYNSAYIN